MNREHPNHVVHADEQLDQSALNVVLGITGQQEILGAGRGVGRTAAVELSAGSGRRGGVRVAALKPGEALDAMAVCTARRSSRRRAACHGVDGRGMDGKGRT